MSDSTKVPYLRAVMRGSARSPNPGAASFEAPAWQKTLFVTHNESLLAFVDFSSILEAEFLELLLSARARFVVDLRLVPRFDAGTLTRKMVFSLFAQLGSQYLDMSGELGVKDKRDANLNPGLLAGHLLNVVGRTRKEFHGPIVFLVDAPQFTEAYVDALAGELSVARASGWEIIRTPVAEPSAEKKANRRDLIFISHANPEDNDFTKWLGLQLSANGYRVWSDVTQLLGGELFWTTIEEAIREYSAKVVVVLSAPAQSKQGVLDEINCAIGVERAKGLDGFVIPIRLDELPFHEVRANLARKNIIDFFGNWAVGLSRLLALLERDGAPKANTDGQSVLAEWSRRYAQMTTRVEERPQILVSNWLRIERLPTYFAYEYKGEEGSASQVAVERLGFRHGDFRVWLAESEDEVLDHSAAGGVVSLEEALRFGCEAPLAIDAATVGRQLTSLLRQGWDRFAESRGLLPYEISSGAIAWYSPNGFSDGNNVSFHSAGKTRRKALVGRSEKRSVFWHYAAELQPVVGKVRRYVLVPHIVFTEDGTTGKVGKERMHTLRRQFCKNWWNDRWRDLNFAFLSWLSQGSASVRFSFGSRVAIPLSTEPMRFRLPVSVPSPNTQRIDELMQDVEWEDLDVLEEAPEKDLGIAGLGSDLSDLDDD